MIEKIFESILKEILSQYLLMTDDELEVINSNHKSVGKERIATLNDLQIIIYSNDHNPPHFHVKTKDLEIDAKFTIENCELLSGEVSSKQLKRIKSFHSSPKGLIVMLEIWNKKSSN